MTLQTAAQLALKTLESGELLCELTAASMLRVALSDEQAQAVEPVAWMYNWYAEEGEAITNWFTSDYDEAHSPTMGCHNIRPLYIHPAPPPAGERASLIRRADASVIALNSRIMEPFYCSLDQDAARVLSDCVDMLEADVSLINEGNKAQQVAVPDGWALVPIEPTLEMIMAAKSYDYTNPTDPTWGGIYSVMLAAAQGAKPETEIPVSATKTDWSAA